MAKLTNKHRDLIIRVVKQLNNKNLPLNTVTNLTKLLLKIPNFNEVMELLSDDRDNDIGGGFATFVAADFSYIEGNPKIYDTEEHAEAFFDDIHAYYQEAMIAHILRFESQPLQELLVTRSPHFLLLALFLMAQRIQLNHDNLNQAVMKKAVKINKDLVRHILLRVSKNQRLTDRKKELGHE